MKKIFSNSKPRIASAFALAIALIILSFFAVRGEGLHYGKLILALLLSILAAGIVAVRPVLKNKIGITAASLLIPALTVCCVEFLTHVPADLTVPIFFLNYLFYLVFYLTCTCVLGNARWGYPVGTLLPMLFAVTNYFVVSFRSSPIVPWDFLSLKTAASVTASYTFSINYRLVFVMIGFVYLMVLGEKLRLQVGKGIRARLCACALSIGGLAGYVAGVQSTFVENTFSLDTTLFTPNVLYRNNGLAVAFLANIQYLNIQKPDGYSLEYAQEIAQNATAEATAAEAVTKDETKEQPNVIVIMNEAFSDLSVYGDFETSEDYMPFIRSLSENTVKANLYVSVKGGNTANTEFEFLTGNSMAFLPTGSVPYQQFIKESMPSLATQMKKLGYRTVALHPYYASGWNRDQVYEYLGFDEKYFISDFTNASLLRGWVDDRSAFQKIIDLYEEKEEGEKLFAFEVTMQNHGGYSKEYTDLQADITLTGYDNEIKNMQIQATEKYLTLIKKSDEAFEELVEYFTEQDEPTIIVMFGDHQPSDYVSNPIKRLLGFTTETEGLTLDELAAGYTVPMVMWANYDIEEENIEEISCNYLSSLVMEKAGLAKSGYQLYLDTLRESYPVITANFYKNSQGEWDEIAELVASEDPFTLNSYATLQYNDLRDSKNRLQAFFDE